MDTESVKKYYKDRYDELKHITDCRNAHIDIKRGSLLTRIKNCPVLGKNENKMMG